MTEAKPWYQSRTLIFNALTLLVVAAGFVVDNVGLLDLPTQAGVWATLVVAMANAYLRLITAQPVAGTPAAKGIPPTGPG